MNCKKCGNLLTEGQKFCNACGTPCEVVNPMPPVAPTPEVASVSPVAPEQVTPVAPMPAVSEASPVNPTPQVAPPVTPTFVVESQPTSVAPVQPVQASAPVQAPMQPTQAPVPPVNPTPMPQPTSVPTPHKKKSNGAFIIIVVVCVIVLVVLAVMLWNNMSTNNNGGDSTTTTMTTTTTSTTTSTTTVAQVSQNNYQTLYGYKIMIPEGFESTIEDEIVYIYNRLSKKQIALTLGGGTMEMVGAEMEAYKAKLLSEGYTDVNYINSTYKDKVYYAVSFAYNGQTFTEYYIQLETDVFVDVLTFYTNVIDEQEMKDFAFSVCEGIEAPGASFAGTTITNNPISSSPTIKSFTE